MTKAGVIGEYTLRVRVTVAILLLLFGVGLIVAFVLAKNYRSELTYASTVLGGVAALYMAYYIGKSLRQNTILTQQQRSFDMIGFLHSTEMNQVRAFIDSEIKHAKVLPSDIDGKITQKPETEYAVRGILNYFEDISIAIQKGYADEDIMYTDLSFVVPYIFESFKPHVVALRTRLDCQLVYCEAEKLVNAWKAGRYLSTGAVAAPLGTNTPTSI
ncbi:MAG: DUF4760 domain-containing protein [Planctomycetota bacterium]